MIYSQTKPLHFLDTQLRYLIHKSHLSEIQNAPTQMYQTSLNTPFKQLHARSISYHNRLEQLKITKENQQLYSKLLKISQRKHKQRNQQLLKLNLFNNPLRKERQKNIAQNNHRLAVNIIEHRSQFNSHKVKKEIEEYEKLKNTLKHNKKFVTLGRIRTESTTERLKGKDKDNSSTHQEKEPSEPIHQQPLEEAPSTPIIPKYKQKHYRVASL